MRSFSGPQRLLTVGLVVSCALSNCQGRPPYQVGAVDPRVVLASRLTHGLGDDALDSPLLRDSVNADILVRARLGVDSAALMQALGSSDAAASRLDALIAANLLRRDGSLLRTTVPIVMGPDEIWYDSITKAWAVSALPEVKAPLDTLVRHLTRRGWQPWTYHFVWSQVFDSQRLWAAIQRAGVTPPLTPAITWVIYPANPGKTGTNLFPGRIETSWYLSVTWTPTHKAHLSDLENAADTLIGVISGSPVSDSARRRLTFLGLLTPAGTPAVPVLQPNDSLLENVGTLAQRWTGAVRQSINAALVAERLRIEPRVAWAMVYHDVSWSALAELIRLGVVPALPASGFVPPAHGSAALVPADPLFLSVLLDSGPPRPAP